MGAQPESGYLASTEVRPEVQRDTLVEIRDALTVPQDREGFDAGLKKALEEVRVTLDLGIFGDFLRTWRMIAIDAKRDPEGRQRMWERAAEITANGTSGESRSMRDVLAERGVQF